MKNQIRNLTVAQLQRAVALKRSLERLESKLAALCGGAPTARRKRKMSAAGRAAISRAAKARWARERAAK